MANHGLKYVKPVKGDYIHGSRLRLGGLPLQPDGQWDEYVPTDEIQRLTIETASCTSYGTLNAIEILIRRLFVKDVNYSDRFLAWASETKPDGNDPQKVCESLRKKGCALQQDWPFTYDIKTLDEYYTPPPWGVQVSAQQ